MKLFSMLAVAPLGELCEIHHAEPAEKIVIYREDWEGQKIRLAEWMKIAKRGDYFTGLRFVVFCTKGR